MTALKMLDVNQRLTILDRVGSPANGDSLAGQNVNAYPEGALFYVRASNRLYELRKNLDALVVQNSLYNVVDGVGSSAADGRFIAVDQWGTLTLSGGTGLLPGFDLTEGGFFQCTYVTIGGTPGILHGAKTAANSMTVTSSSNTDTSVVLVVFKESPSEI